MKTSTKHFSEYFTVDPVDPASFKDLWERSIIVDKSIKWVTILSPPEVYTYHLKPLAAKCSCDIKNLLSTGHDDGCCERKR